MARNDVVIKIGSNVDDLKKGLNTAKGALRVFSAAIVASGTGVLAATQRFAAFQSGLSDVITLLDDGSFKTKSFTDGIGDLKKGVLQLRSETGESFEKLNKGLFDLISAGVDAEKAIDALRVSTNLAIAGATDTSVAVDGITSALNAYSLEAGMAQSVAEKFFTAQKGGKTTIEELSNSFGLAGATASAFGVSLDELLAAVSAATTGGIKTNAAYTGLNAVLANIAKPTADAAKEAERLGIEFNSTALRSKGLKGFLDEISSSAGFTDTSLEKLFGSVEALKIAQSLTGAQSDEFADILSKIGDSSLTATNFQNALAVKMEDVNQVTKRLGGVVDAAAVSIGEKFAPYLVEAANRAIDFASDAEKVDRIGNTLLSTFKFLGELLNNLLGPAFQVIQERLQQVSEYFKRTSDENKALYTGLQILSKFLGAVLGHAINGVALTFEFALQQLSNFSKGLTALSNIFQGISRIISESLNALMAKFDEFAAVSLRSIASVIEQAQKLADVLPFVENSFQGSINAINTKADEYEQKAKERAERSAEFFGSSEAAKTQAQAEGLETRNQQQFENDALMDEYDAENREAKLELDQERREEDLELEDERNKVDFEREQAKQEQLNKIKEDAKKEETKNKKAAEKDLVKIKQQRVDAEENLDAKLADSAFSALRQIVGDNKAAQTALLIARKAMAVSSILVNAQEAASLAIATIPPPAGEAIAAQRLAMGNVQAGIAAATTIPQLAGTFGAQKGGIVPGMGSGDKIPFLLEPGETIVPKALTPNFFDLINGAPQTETGGQPVSVHIALDEEASRIFTLKQREDRALGVSR